MVITVCVYKLKWKYSFDANRAENLNVSIGLASSVLLVGTSYLQKSRCKKLNER